jgi:exopolysaccharide production protein ExoY
MALQRTARNEDQGGSLVWRLITEPATKFLITASAGVSRKSTAGRFAANDVPLGGRGKRILDICIAALALILLLPLMLALALLIKLRMGGPVVFAHARVGLNGKSFSCYKFRTMVNDAEDVLQRCVDSDQGLAREWAETRKLSRDPRITPLGHILRKASLDELPQLFNVLRGDMSCVGPRPIVAAELERYGDRAEEYLRARPGLTGLWQVSGRSTLSYADRVTLDDLYVRNWSLLLDLAIMAKTVPAVLNFNEAS